MSERVRRIKKEGFKVPRPVKVAAVFLVVLILAGVGGYLVRRRLKLVPTQVAAMKDTNLTAVFCEGEEKCFWLNRQGIIFSEAGRSSGNAVLNISDNTHHDFKTGDTALSQEFLAKLLFLRQSILDETDVLFSEAEIQDLNSGDFNFKNSEGWILKVNFNDNGYKILETFKKALPEISKTAPVPTLDYIDLRISNKVYYKFK